MHSYLGAWRKSRLQCIQLSYIQPFCVPTVTQIYALDVQ